VEVQIYIPLETVEVQIVIPLDTVEVQIAIPLDTVEVQIAIRFVLKLRYRLQYLCTQVEVQIAIPLDTVGGTDWNTFGHRLEFLL